MKTSTKKRGNRPAFPIQTLFCSALNSKGQGICWGTGPVTFVSGLLPGERAEVELTCQKKNYSVGRIVTLLDSSPHRVEPPCPWAGRCGGCQLAHASYSFQLDLKRDLAIDAHRRIGKRDVDLKVTPSPKQWGYRNKAAFPVTPWGIGFYASGSHDLVPVDCCPLLEAQLERAYQALRPHPLIAGLEPYDERRGKGLLRHLVLRSDGDGGTHLLLVLNSQTVPQKLRAAAPTLVSELGLASLVVNFNTAPGNRILTERTEALVGEGVLRHHLGSHRLNHDATAFFQVNDGAADLLFRHAADLVEGRVLELFSGVGSLTCYIASRAQSVHSVEVWGPAVEQAKVNTAPFGNVFCHLADAGRLDSSLFEEVDTLVVDPPRSGLDAATVERALESGAHRLVYVSCDPATLARDLSLLTQGPRAFCLEGVRGFDLFPQTAHLEQMALLSR